MNILLINPFQYLNINRFMHRVFPVANITPAYLQSLVPPGHSVRIIDEAKEPIDYDLPADLVCITTITVNASRAYGIAGQFRKRGAQVVLGGPHASALPEEARNHCDAVAIGNAESMFEQIISDAEGHSLKPYYHNRIPDRIPERATGSAQSNWQTSILASRGCELRCSFCSSQNIFGKFYLQRRLRAVLDDIDTIETRYVNFLDDNFYGASDESHAYYDEILRALSRKKIHWLAQVRLPILNDDVLKKFRESGCAGFLIGFESINSNNMVDVGKKVDAEYFRDEIRRIHDNRLGVVGSFIFGFDEDTPETIDETVEFCIKSKMELAAFSVLTPYPGTKVFADLEKEGRILTTDWDQYDSDRVVFQPKNFTPHQLEEKLIAATKKFYTVSSIYNRMKFGMNYNTMKLYLLPNILRKYAMTFR